MPEIEDLKMIQCSTCSEWYHIDAYVQVSEEVIKKKDLPFGYVTTVIKFLYNVVYSQFKSLLQ